MPNQTALLAIITGMEHSGTTYLSKLLSCHPDVNTGFECGVLLGNSPQDFSGLEPFYSWMQEDIKKGHWGISGENMRLICGSTTWEEMYGKIARYSPIFTAERYILDKTPGYMAQLDAVLGKVTVPCLVVRKNIQFQYVSYKKRGLSLDAFIARYLAYTAGLNRALQRFPDRIHVIEYENLHHNTLEETKTAYEFIGLEFDESRITTSGIFDSRITNFEKAKGFRTSFDYGQEQSKIADLTPEELAALRQLEDRTFP